MNAETRAAQLWPLLAWTAVSRQVLTYGTVSKLIGVPAGGLGQLLEPIQSYCLLRKLPALTVVVVNQETGTPGSGFVAGDFASQLQLVHGHAWLDEHTPSPEEFAKAVRDLPSNANEALRSKGLDA